MRVREREESCKRQKMRIQKVKCNVNVSATVLLPNNIFTWYNDNNANATMQQHFSFHFSFYFLRSAKGS